MKSQLYAVYDKAVGAYLQPFHMRSRGEALRSFIDACQPTKDGSPFSKSPEDYFLFYIGEWDDADAKFSAPDVPERVLSALEAVRQ